MTDALRVLVMARQVAPGDRLMEVSLATRLGVSRTPIRAALAALEKEGLLVYRPQRGYVVRQFSLTDILGAYRVRAHLEGLACRIVAETGPDATTQKVIEACLRSGDTILRHGCLRDEDNEPWRTMNNNFHQAILSATGNLSLTEAIQRTLALPFVSTRVVFWHDHAALSSSHHLHHMIVHAIIHRHGERAEALMREHILLASEIIAERYDTLALGGAKD